VAKIIRFINNRLFLFQMQIEQLTVIEDKKVYWNNRLHEGLRMKIGSAVGAIASAGFSYFCYKVTKQHSNPHDYMLLLATIPGIFAGFTGIIGGLHLMLDNHQSVKESKRELSTLESDYQTLISYKTIDDMA
jgi:hypothetical protein